MGIAAYKASGECVFANEALARMVGGSPSEMLQDNFRRLEFWRQSGLLQLAEEALSQGAGPVGRGLRHHPLRQERSRWTAMWLRLSATAIRICCSWLWTSQSASGPKRCSRLNGTWP